MLWYKGWLETRFRLLMALGMVVLMGSTYVFGMKTKGLGALAGTAAILVALLSIILAGAGIVTQPALQTTKGLHGSMLFTLSMPVSRFRLLAVRATVGWLEVVLGILAMCFGMWILFPELRGMTTGLEMLEYAGTLIVCASGLYSIPVLLATFLDDQWRLYGSALSFGALWWLSNHMGLPASANVFRAITVNSPLIAHSVPWFAMALSMGMCGVLFFAAVKIVQAREY
jgi:hypothetical protein